MNERSRLFFFTNTLGGLPNPNTRPAVVVETAPAEVQMSQYETLVASLSADEKLQLERIRPALQKMIAQVRLKFKTPDFRDVLVQHDTFQFSLPEKVSPAVIAICTRALNYEHKRAIDEHNAGVQTPKQLKDDLHKLN